MKKSEISLLIALGFCFIVNYFTDVNTTAAMVREDTLRLHIIAHDDSIVSQQIKLCVRDDLQELFKTLYNQTGNIDDAIQTTQKNLDYIQAVANSSLEKQGAEYKAMCSIEKFYFETTRYDNFTMPRGEYTALSVRLGDGLGRNWWCVAYPTLCLSSSAKYEDDSANTFIETDSLRIKFKAVEIWEGFKQQFSRTDKYSSI